MDTVDSDMEWLREQMDAAAEMIHHYKCVHCRMATAQQLLVIITDVEGGSRVTMVGVCDTCKEI